MSEEDAEALAHTAGFSFNEPTLTVILPPLETISVLHNQITKMAKCVPHGRETRGRLEFMVGVFRAQLRTMERSIRIIRTGKEES